MKNTVNLRAVVESNLVMMLQQQWREVAVALGAGARITSISHTYQEKDHDQLCVLEVIAQWMENNHHPTSEALQVALASYFTKGTDLPRLEGIIIVITTVTY